MRLKLSNYQQENNLQKTLRLQPIGIKQPLALVLLPIQLGKDSVLACAVLPTTQLLQMHLIRPIGNPQRPNHRPQIRQWRVLADTRSAIRLHRTVDDSQRRLRNKHLGLRDFLKCRLGIALVDLDGCVEDDESRGVDLDARPRDPFQDHSVRGQTTAEGLLAVVVDAGNEPFNGLFGRADGAHGVVDTAGAETTLDDLEAAAFAQDHVGDWHSHVLECDVAVAMGSIVVAVDGEHALHGHSRGVGGD